MLSILHPLQGLSIFKYFTRSYPSATQKMSIYDHTVKNIDDEEFSLAQLKGKVTLIVNVASECGFTPQYEGLNELQKKFAERGFTVIAFPCNQFGSQEPDTCPRIKAFATDKYKATFPLMYKVDVNGSEQSPVYATIQSTIPGNVKWNFEKVLVNKNGVAVQKFASVVEPSAIEPDIEALLAEKYVDDVAKPATATSVPPTASL